MPNGPITHLKILIVQRLEFGRNDVYRKRYYALGICNLGLCERSRIGDYYLIDDCLFYLVGKFGVRNEELCGLPGFDEGRSRIGVAPNLDAVLMRRHAHTDRKSTRLNSSHLGISYAVFCLKKK